MSLVYGQVMTEMDRLLRTREVAEVLAVSVRTVSRMIAEGTLPVVRFGDSVRVSQEALRLFIERSGGEGPDAG